MPLISRQFKLGEVTLHGVQEMRQSPREEMQHRLVIHCDLLRDLIVKLDRVDAAALLLSFVLEILAAHHAFGEAAEAPGLLLPEGKIENALAHLRS